MVVLLLGGSLLRAVEQEADASLVRSTTAPTTYAVLIADRGIPSWFSDLRITSLKRIDRPMDASLLIRIHGGDPTVEWTSVDRKQTAINRRWGGGGTFSSQPPDGMSGRGQLPCWITVERRSVAGAVETLATLDLSRADSEVRWSAPWATQSYTWLPSVGGPTPTGTASAWGRQAWAEAYRNAEIQLGWLAERGWRLGEVYSP